MKINISILGEGPTQSLDDTTLTAEAVYPINFTQPNKTFVLSVHYNGSKKFLFVNATKIYQFRQIALNEKIMYCVSMIFQKIFQLTIWKK